MFTISKKLMRTVKQVSVIRFGGAMSTSTQLCSARSYHKAGEAPILRSAVVQLQAAIHMATTGDENGS